jgi:hypothetical protein
MEIVPPDQITADHREPRCKRGLTIPDNIALACRPCNAAKGAMSEARFRTLIKGPAPRGDLGAMRAWARRKIALACVRSRKRLAIFAGLPPPP